MNIIPQIATLIQPPPGVYAPLIPIGGLLTMRGKIRTPDVCPVCQGKFTLTFHPATEEKLLMCESHLTVPQRFFIDGRDFRNRKGNIGRISKDERGERLSSYRAAFRLLEAIRADWDKDPVRFDPTRWSLSGRGMLKLKECAREWQLRLEQDPEKSTSRANTVEWAFREHLLTIPIGDRTFGEIDIREIVPDDIEAAQFHLHRKGLSRSSIRTVLSVLRTLLIRYRDRKRVLDWVPAFPEGWSSMPSADRWWVDGKVQQAIIARMPERSRLLMGVLCETGMRPGEGEALRKRDILPGRRIHIQRSIDVWRKEGPPKAGKARYCDINEELYQKLIVLPVIGDGYLFTTKGGMPWTTTILSREFRRAADAAGFPQVTLYTCIRHSLASKIKMEAEKKAIAEASTRLGNTARMAKDHYIQGEGMLVNLAGNGQGSP